MKIVITGARGLLGWHTAVRLHAANCAARFKGIDAPFDIIQLDHFDFDDDARLHAAVSGADGILHFAGLNRAPDNVIEYANPAIARRLVEACIVQNVTPHIVYSNSIHSSRDSHYGRSKRIAGEILAQLGGSYTDLVLPHVFGECARPHYNNVTATLIDALLSGRTPDINTHGQVSLLHAGVAAEAAISAVVNGQTGRLHPVACDMAVSELFEILKGFHESYCQNTYPDLSESFTVALFNTYRAALYPSRLSNTMRLNSDSRGLLFEAVKGGGGGQTFLSTTKPGATRGDHFHLRKVERFLVIQGTALIRIRKVLGDEVLEYHVSGDTPTSVEMPTLHTHSIVNAGSNNLLTLFWCHELFDPENTDTFADRVVR